MDALSQLRSAHANFSRDPMRCVKTMRDLAETQPDEFRAASVEVLEDYQDTRDYACLLTLLGGYGALIPSLLILAGRNAPNLVPLVQAAVRHYLLLPSSLVDQLAMVPASPTPEQEQEMHLWLRLLECSIQGGGRRAVLKRLLDSPNCRLRSKAALLSRSIDVSGPASPLCDADVRVRANALAALWSERSPEALAAFHLASSDPAPRVAANALIGLYLAGEEESLNGIERLSQDPADGRRASAAWAMGRTGESRFHACLKRLLSDPSPLVRANAVRALNKIRKAQAERPAPADPLIPISGPTPALPNLQGQG